MKFTALVFCSFCAAAVTAHTFSAPVYAVKRSVASREQNSLWMERRLARRRADYRLQRDSRVQAFLEANESKNGEEGAEICQTYEECGIEREDLEVEMDQEDEEFASPAWDWNELAQITTLSMGTPPQPIRVIISISDNDLFVPSSQCDSGCKNHLFYNSSLSSTHEENGTTVMSNFLRVSSPAFLSQDVVHVDNMQIHDQIFSEGTSLFHHSPAWISSASWDGYLGLAPRSNGSDTKINSVFQNMVAQGLLDRNVFSLKMSRGPDDPGEIMFGSINHKLYSGKLRTLKLVGDEGVSERVKGRWKVAASAVEIGPGLASLEGYVATIESDFPGIGLPSTFVTLLHDFLGMETLPKYDFVPSIACSKRESLEDLTIYLGKEKFSISAREYTFEVQMEGWSEKRCVSAFMGLEEGDGYVILGSAFLRAFYGVFDLDEMTISFGDVVVADEVLEL